MILPADTQVGVDFHTLYDLDDVIFEMELTANRADCFSMIGMALEVGKRKPALKYSFMLYIPISLGTMLLGVKDMISQNNISGLIIPYFLGFASSLIVSYYTLRWFKKAVSDGKLIYFSIYCLILGILVITLL